jgi:hypothetical protein
MLRAKINHHTASPKGEKRYSPQRSNLKEIDLKIVGCSGIRETFVKDTTPRLKY